MTTFDNSCHKKTKTNGKFISCDGIKNDIFPLVAFSLPCCNKIKFVAFKCRNCELQAQESEQQSTFMFFAS